VQVVDPLALSSVRVAGRILFKLANDLAALLGEEVQVFGSHCDAPASLVRVHAEASTQVVN
jgi:hypothetical protein